MNRTALYDRHRALGAKMTDFHGWEMPLYYTSIIEEHKAVRETLGLFDISHMAQFLVTGREALAALNRLCTSDLAQVGEGRACYTLMLNEAGGVLDDLIVYRTGEDALLVIANCGTHASDFEWIRTHCQGQASVTDISEGRAILAVQGPQARRVLEHILDARVTSLGRFAVAPIRTMGPAACIARTGYTGSDGFELFLPKTHAQQLWGEILSVAAPLGALPVGLGARDTLRIEAGLRLYGVDMDETTSPFEAGLGWTVAIHKGEFIGREALLRQQAQGIQRTFIGFELSQGPVPRGGCELTAEGRRIGAVTSGTYSPILNKPLGMGYVEPACAKPGSSVSVTIRSQRHRGTVVKLPFWRGRPQQTAYAPTSAPTLEP